jgi:hypothetical protein
MRRAGSFVAGVSPIILALNRIVAQAVGALLPTDEAIILNRLARGVNEGLSRLPMGDLVAEMGRSFLGRPYQANPLEEEGDEHLVVNLRTFDCVTLCETSLALARAIKLHADSASVYSAQLKLIRYRSGVIDGYASRLHYFWEWIADNEKKKVLKDVTEDLGGRRDRRTVNFMSAHQVAYSRLASDSERAAIIATEKHLSDSVRYVVPKEMVGGMLDRIDNGDIIAITTSVHGLDVSHTGIAVREGGITRLLHAPNVGQRVEISESSLAAYLKDHSTQTGIMIARPLDPAA